MRIGKLIIQIPCYNEEQTLATALRALPRELPNVDKIEWLLIDDGSRDRSVEVARECGVQHIASIPVNGGLANAFMVGITACLRHGADVIVNTDADNQYNADDIPKLLEPILDGRAEVVVGARPIGDIQDFSPIKKQLQKLGSWVVRLASGTDIPDAPSGFRAMTRNAALQLCVQSEYTYTLDTIIQCGRKNISITSVPVRVNGFLRPSRLVKSIPSYVWRSILTILRIYMLYKPVRFFTALAITFMVPGIFYISRFLYFYALGQGDGKIQSLILASVLIICGFLMGALGVISDLIAANRRLLEDIRSRTLAMECDQAIRKG